MVSGPRVGIDFGTTHTVAVCQWRDGPVYPLLFDASPLLPSAVFAAAGRLLVGRDAERSARADPAAFEPSPKQRVDDGTILLGTGEFAVVDVIAAVLRRCLDEAERVAGPPAQVVLTYPASWATHRQAVLAGAATRAGVPRVTLVPEPAAAALYFSHLVERQDGRDAVVVYDFGGGTFDVAVVRRHGTDWEVVACAGLEDVGGLDLDGLLIDLVRAGLSGRDPGGWSRLTEPRTTADRRHRRLLWEDARAAKEQLSRNAVAQLHIPVVDADVHVTREEFEGRARPVLERTVTLTAETLSRGGLTPTQVAGVFLVGGSSRIPLVATLLHQRLGVAPVITEQPELVVAQGALLAVPRTDAAGGLAPVPMPAPAYAPPPEPAESTVVLAAPVRSAAVPVPPVPGPPVSAPPVSSPASVQPVQSAPAPAARPSISSRRRWVTVGAVLAVVVATVTTVVLVLNRETPLNAQGERNATVFTSPQLRSFARSWLNGSTSCVVHSPDTTESEKVQCIGPQWAINFRAYPNAAAREQARQLRRSSFSVRSDQDLSGSGPRSGVLISYLQDDTFHVVYWDDEDAPVSGDLFAYASESPLADLLKVWDDNAG